MNKKLRIALLVFLVIGIVSIFVYIKIPRENSEGGYLTLIVKNIDNDVVEQKRLKYEKEDSAFDVLNKYFTISCMPLVSSGYWNMVHGSKAEDVLKDEEGLQVMRTLGRNMAWILKCIDLGKSNGVERPASERKIRTNFIR